MPLGNLSAGLAWAYAALALGWLVLSWKDSGTGLFGLRGDKLPFTGSFAPALELDSTRSPLAAANTIWDALSARPTLLFEAIVLAAVAVALPHIRRRRIAPFGLALLAGILAPGPVLPDAAIVITILVTCLGLAVKDRS